jgi:hypothetical protein
MITAPSRCDHDLVASAVWLEHAKPEPIRTAGAGTIRSGSRPVLRAVLWRQQARPTPSWQASVSRSWRISLWGGVDKVQLTTPYPRRPGWLLRYSPRGLYFGHANKVVGRPVGPTEDPKECVGWRRQACLMNGVGCMGAASCVFQFLIGPAKLPCEQSMGVTSQEPDPPTACHCNPNGRDVKQREDVLRKLLTSWAVSAYPFRNGCRTCRPSVRQAFRRSLATARRLCPHRQ